MAPIPVPSADVALVLEAMGGHGPALGAIFDRTHRAMFSGEREVQEAAASATYNETRAVLADAVRDQSVAGPAASALRRVLADQDQSDELMFHLGILAGGHSQRFRASQPASGR